MKKIEAVIPPSRLDVVRAELARRGVWGKLTLTDVQQGETHKSSIGTENGSADSLHSRIKIELIVADPQVDKAINVILRHAVSDPSESGADEHGGQVTLLHIDEILQIAPPARENP
ncbi:MAG: P-II family nitrogen regulator [Verrucomicrobia bacterium]|nr:P-II family nitrogen regulator [Verrucomicrobiota bacterium]MBV9273284.1 P-II family nitrogen regulator [Verrucomicrobiota bacterium]